MISTDHSRKPAKSKKGKEKFGRHAAASRVRPFTRANGGGEATRSFPPRCKKKLETDTAQGGEEYVSEVSFDMKRSLAGHGLGKNSSEQKFVQSNTVCNLEEKEKTTTTAMTGARPTKRKDD